MASVTPHISPLETPKTLLAPVQEVFSSIQGEGPYIGLRQVFVRFAHCHLKCAYCDTPMETPTGQCHVESVPNQGHQYRLENPLAPEALLEAVERLLDAMPHHSVSFTGGEPLLYHRFLADFMPKIRPLAKTYLETSGTQAEFLAAVLSSTDIIAMDIKLPSSTLEPERFAEHKTFYKLAKTSPKTALFIKLVFNNQTTLEEMAAVVDIVSHRQTPVILQPESTLYPKQGEALVNVDARHMARLQSYLCRYFSDVRIIPQSHKMLRVL